MLMVAPSGIEKLQTFGDIPSFSVQVLMFTGMAAELEVPSDSTRKISSSAEYDTEVFADEEENTAIIRQKHKQHGRKAGS